MYKLCLGLLLGVLLTISPCLASDDDSEELEARCTELFVSIAKDYKRLPDLYDKGKYEQLLQEAQCPEDLAFFSMIPAYLQEPLLFLYFRHVGMAWYKMAVKNDHDDAYVTVATDNARGHLQYFLEWIRAHVDPESSPQSLVFATQLHAAQVNGDLGVVNSQLFPDRILKAHTIEAAQPGLDLFGVSVLYLQRAHTLYKATARSLPNYSRTLQNHVECIFEALNKGVLMLRTCDPCIKTSLRTEIKKYNKEVLAPLDKAMASTIQAAIDRFDQSKAAPKTASRYKKLGSATKGAIAKKETDHRLSAISDTAGLVVSDCNLQAITDPKGRIGVIRVIAFGLSGDCIRFQSQTDQVALLAGRLMDLEELLSGYYGLGSDVKAIYQQLHESFDDDVHSCALPVLTTILTKSGDIGGAIERLEALMEVQQRDYGKASAFLRAMYAYNKQLLGDSKPWLDLEREKAEQATAKSAAKKKKQAKARQMTAEAIKEESRAAKEEAEKAAQVAAAPKARPQVQVSRDDKGKEEASFVPSEDFKSSEQLKAEKIARHAAKQEERTTQAAQAAQQPQMIPIATRPAKEAAVEDEIPEISLVTAYNLKSTAKAVDEAIEQGTWDFTRDQLKTYLKAMGCDYRSGRGIHEVMELPNQVSVDVQSLSLDFNSTHIVKNDEVITVFIDMGGSLTLPWWEKGRMRDYLKKQIMSARNQLKKLAYKAQLELEKTKE